MVSISSINPRLLSSFTGDCRLASGHILHQLFSSKQGGRHAKIRLSRSLSGITSLLFNRRSYDDKVHNKRKHLVPGIVSPCLPVPDHIRRPPYVNSRQPPGIASGPEVHDEKGMEKMRASGRLAAQVLDYAGTLVKPGVTTDEIDKAVHQMIIENDAYPSPLGYGGFQKSICTSVNECICHGIPDSRALEGYHGDTSATFICGNVDDSAKQLVQVTRECMYKAISICAAGVELKKIGKAIQDHANKYHYGVVRQFVGHGIGQVFHADPDIDGKFSQKLFIHNLLLSIFEETMTEGACFWDKPLQLNPC